MPVPQLQLSPQGPQSNRVLFPHALLDVGRRRFPDTEAHFTPEKSALRSGTPDLAALWDCLDASQQALLDKAEPRPLTIAGNLLRLPQGSGGAAGFFRLTVPTGGGKTLSGLAFALRPPSVTNWARDCGSALHQHY